MQGATGHLHEARVSDVRVRVRVVATGGSAQGGGVGRGQGRLWGTHPNEKHFEVKLVSRGVNMVQRRGGAVQWGVEMLISL